ncbi:MAG: YceH family protein [Acidobacteriota bacterium]
MAENLSETEVRVLGCLVEKQLTTPEYYPLTLNALVSACNQKSNRDPVVSYDDTVATEALDSLRDKNLVYVFYGSTSRVVKYKHMLPSVYSLDPGETAVVTVLMLRGPQTAGEIRGRSDRLYDFEGVGQVQQTLDELASRAESLVVKLERQPGQKDARYAHLLSGPVDAASINLPRDRAAGTGVLNERVEKLEQELGRVSTELGTLRETVEEFRKQFE